jgi:hypothetical protein
VTHITIDTSSGEVVSASERLRYLWPQSPELSAEFRAKENLDTNSGAILKVAR